LPPEETGAILGIAPVLTSPSYRSMSPSNVEGSWLVTIAASAGGIEALRILLHELPRDLPAAVVVVQHRPAHEKKSYLTEILGRVARLPVVEARDDQPIAAGTIYVARPNLHLTVSREKRFSYRDGSRICFLYSSANPLFATAATAFGPHLIAIVLTGGGRDATDGVQTVKAHGGTVIVQDPRSARHPGMPHSAIATGAVDYVLRVEEIAAAIGAIMRNGSMRGGPAM
jgi:two-component system chemotaxis response regulator CheB